MPIWPVSFVDGVYQVADADGAHYPLTMQHVGVAHFNPGWRPRGLQTGLPPLHVLELVHDDGGQEAIWFMDELLDYRGNGVVHLNADDRSNYLATVEPMVREIFEQAVRSRHDAVPAAAHGFEGFLPSSVRELLGLAVAQAIPRPDVVRPGALRDVGAYGRDGITLPAPRVEELLRDEVPVDGPGVMELGAHRALRRFDEVSGATTYLLQGTDPADRHLYVPAAGVVFGEGDAAHDPVLPLVLYYATHLDRAVPLPEVADIGFELLDPYTPPQHGLDEPPVAVVGRPEPSPEPDPTATDHATIGRGGAEQEAAASPPAAPERVREVAAVGSPAREEPAPAPRRFDDTGAAAERVTLPDGGALREPVLAAAGERVGSPHGAPDDRSAATGRQNWWQRLLGLGNP